MLLSDIFSIPFLMCLAICILLIGCSSIYFYQRIQQQDHKISSMVSLISSMAEETPIPTASTRPASNGGNIIIDIKPSHDNRIPVSDDDESEYESDSDSETEYSTTSSEEEEEDICEILSEMEELDYDVEDICINNIDLPIISAVSLEEEREKEKENDLEKEKEKVQEKEESNVEETRSIHLEQPTDFSLFKTISVIGDVVSDATDDINNYKKMSLPKLREIAQINGLGDTSKLKKQELLKLLGVE